MPGVQKALNQQEAVHRKGNPAEDPQPQYHPQQKSVNGWVHVQGRPGVIHLIQQPVFQKYHRKMMTADQVAETLVQKITEDMPLESGDEVSVMVNGLGATPLEEQLIVYRRVHALLTQMGVRIFMPHIGEYATSMEMAGLSLTIMKLDEVLKGLLSQTARSPFYTNYNK